MTDHSQSDEKELLRQNLKSLRAQVSQLAGMASALALWSQLKQLPQFNNAKRIAAFVPTQTEINMTPILEGILCLQKELYLPKADPAQTLLGFYPVSDLKKLMPGSHHIPEPPSMTALPPEKLDLILVPGLAFDRRGYRLGYGKGYYDRFLSQLGPSCFSIGVGYSFQMIEKVPFSSHDIPVKSLLSEKSFQLCS